MARTTNNSNQASGSASASDLALDPYYIHPSENPTTVCVSPQLEGENNYHGWAKRMQRVLATKNKFRFVDGSIPIPREDDLNFIAWERCNNLVHSWLINSMKPQVAESVVYIENAMDVWKDLKERYLQGDRVRVSTLYQEISNFKQGNARVSDYFTEMRAMWEELDQFRPIPQCTCPFMCVCVAMRSARSYRTEDKIIQFLMGLNEQFKNIRCQILLMEPLSTINKVLSMVLQEERQQSYGLTPQVDAKTESSDALANSVDRHGARRGYGRGRGNFSYQGGRGRGNNSNTAKVCSYCGKNGHTIDICYKKHGYPPNWGYTRGNNGGNSSVNNVEVDHDDEGGNSNVSLTKDQYNSLLALLERNNLDNPQHSTNFVKGESSQCYSAGVAGNTSTHCLSDWIIDTGATDHICNSMHWFMSYTAVIPPISVGLPNGNKILAHVIGKVKLNDDLILDKVLYLLDFNVNLLSVSRLVKGNNCVLSFENASFTIQEKDNMRKIGLAKQSDGLYFLKPCQVSQSISVHSIDTSSNNSGLLWHLRLGHLSFERIKCLNKRYSYIPALDHNPCDVCHMAKQKRLPFPVSNSNATSSFDLIQADIWGPFSIVSVHGFKYFLTIPDDHSRYIWVIMLKTKHEVPAYIQGFVNMVKTQFGKLVKAIRTNNGPEFMLQSFYHEKGILHQKRCVSTPQQNARVERRHQHILNISRALMFQSGLPKVYWSHAIQHAVFFINRTPTKLLADKSPFEILHGVEPDLTVLKPFGCLCYASTLPVNRHKLDARANKCVFLGFTQGMKGYVTLDLHSRKITVSRNVQFYELDFPYKTTSPSDSITENKCTISNQSLNSSTTVELSDNLSDVQLDSSPQSTLTPPRLSTRPKHPPSYLHDYVCNSTTASPYPINTYVNYSHLSSSHLAYAISLITDIEPNSYISASKDP
ncbi:hypothetical protein TSUD_214940 [Trifolium subterraneum]|uniref:Integrase catalytic domain-containing protein n=1 Tax=Trifolium subterraneum TaxID=3900 RepID=A0A2Z6MGN5_TRISU|nr:hypothetical protein TSUD_214940 [Trifolium subterraneum]